MQQYQNNDNDKHQYAWQHDEPSVGFSFKPAHLIIAIIFIIIGGYLGAHE